MPTSSAGFLVSLTIWLTLCVGVQRTSAQECRKPTRPPVALDAYYAPAPGQTGTPLKTTLHQIITNHTRFSYTCVWTILMETDEDPVNTNNVIAIYTGRSIPKTRRDQGQNDMDAWNREHVWPKSHGFPQNMQHAYTVLV
jgi:serine protease